MKTNKYYYAGNSKILNKTANEMTDNTKLFDDIIFSFLFIKNIIIYLLIYTYYLFKRIETFKKNLIEQRNLSSTYKFNQKLFIFICISHMSIYILK